MQAADQVSQLRAPAAQILAVPRQIDGAAENGLGFFLLPCPLADVGQSQPALRVEGGELGVRLEFEERALEVAPLQLQPRQGEARFPMRRIAFEQRAQRGGAGVVLAGGRQLLRALELAGRPVTGDRRPRDRPESAREADAQQRNRELLPRNSAEP